jgi:hypothetical protein
MDANGFIPQVPTGQNVTAIKPGTWNKIATAVNGGRTNITKPNDFNQLGATPVFVTNKTGAAITAPYRAFSLGEPMWPIDNNNLPSCCFRLDSFDALRPVAIVQQPLAVDEIGLAIVAGPSIVEVTNGGAATDRSGNPNASGIVVPGSGDSVQYASERPTSGGFVLAILGAKSGSSGRIFQTPSGGIPAASGSAWGSAICTEADEFGTLLTATATIYNQRTAIVPGNVFILALAVGTRLFVWESNCPTTIPEPDPPVGP